MAESSGFFKSINDRKYTVDWLAKYIASFIGNGVYNGELAVTADGSAMSVTLPSGRAWINGYHYRNDGPLTLPVDNADGVLHRKDTVILRWDVNARSITAQVLKGTPASSPIAPTITRSAEQYDLKIAEISIPAGTTAITQSLITDTRLDNAVCGIVTGVVQQVDTTTLYQQIQDDLTRFRATNEADFNAWVAGLKDVLDDETAGNLLAKINDLAGDGRTTETVKGNADAFAAHVAAVNPHKVTAAQVGALPNPASIGYSIDDFNSGNALKPGIYGFTPSTTNSPFNGWGIVIVRTFKDSVAFWIWQEVYSSFDLSQHLIRHKINDGAWSSWLKPDANKADYASGSIPLATPGLRNIVYNSTPSSSYLGDGVLELIPR